MIRCMYSYTRVERTRNEVIRDIVKVAPIEDKMRETKLRWFGHVKRSVDVPMKRYKRINIPEGRRGRERSKKSLNEVINST